MAAPEPNVVRDLVLAELRCALLRAKSAEVEIEFIGSALKRGLISPAEAIRALEGHGWAGFLDADIMVKLRAAIGADAG